MFWDCLHEGRGTIEEGGDGGEVVKVATSDDKQSAIRREASCMDGGLLLLYLVTILANSKV